MTHPSAGPTAQNPLPALSRPGPSSRRQHNLQTSPLVSPSSNTLTHDSEAAAAGDGLDLAVRQRLGDDGLHLTPEEPGLLWPLSTGLGKNPLDGALELHARGIEHEPRFCKQLRPAPPACLPLRC